MTTQEAIDQLYELIQDRESFMVGDYDKDIYDRDKEALEFAVKAVEKQIPKKIMAVNDTCHVKALDSESAMIYTYSCIHCPNCSKWIVANTNHRYCEHCGQALDWGNGNATD